MLIRDECVFTMYMMVFTNNPKCAIERVNCSVQKVRFTSCLITPSTEACAQSTQMI